MSRPSDMDSKLCQELNALVYDPHSVCLLQHMQGTLCSKIPIRPWACGEQYSSHAG